MEMVRPETQPILKTLMGPEFKVEPKLEKNKIKGQLQAVHRANIACFRNTNGNGQNFHIGKLMHGVSSELQKLWGILDLYTKDMRTQREMTRILQDEVNNEIRKLFEKGNGGESEFRGFLLGASGEFGTKRALLENRSGYTVFESTQNADIYNKVDAIIAKDDGPIFLLSIKNKPSKNHFDGGNYMQLLDNNASPTGFTEQGFEHQELLELTQTAERVQQQTGRECRVILVAVNDCGAIKEKVGLPTLEFVEKINFEFARIAEQIEEEAVRA